MKRSDVRKFRIFFIPIILLISFSWFAFKPGERYFEIAKNLDIFATLFKEVNQLYVDEIDPENFVEVGMDAMVSSLDPYTEYIPEEEIEDFRTSTTGLYAGIGTQIENIGDRIIITLPFENFPAYNSGLKVGDEILAIDDFNVTGSDVNEISNLLKGPVSTEIKLKIKRYGTEGPLNINIIRSRIKVSNISYYGHVTPLIGYIKLEDFTAGAGKEISDALTKLVNSGINGVILDLRENPGGLLSEAVNVVNAFIPKGKVVVETKGRVEEWNKTYETLNEPIDTEIPIVVLVNKSSASASEIVAGAIQDYDRGILVGQNTFGKGLVQTSRSLAYNSQLKITTAKYYTPSGRCIQAIDYSIKNSEGEGLSIPDSLRIAYQTSMGRTVFGEDGLQPDVFIKKIQYAPVVQALIHQGLIFDYATKWYFENGSSVNFNKDQTTFDQFTNWLADKEVVYTTAVEEALLELKASAKDEAYLNDLKEGISSLERAVIFDKKKDIFKNKDIILEILEEEIATRQSLLAGKIKSSFDNDPEILKSIDLLQEKNMIDQILTRK